MNHVPMKTKKATPNRMAIQTLVLNMEFILLAILRFAMIPNPTTTTRTIATKKTGPSTWSRLTDTGILYQGTTTQGVAVAVGVDEVELEAIGLSGDAVGDPAGDDVAAPVVDVVGDVTGDVVATAVSVCVGVCGVVGLTFDVVVGLDLRFLPVRLACP
jgi:hypothetical protein